MSWKPSFDRALVAYNSTKYDEGLKLLDEVIASGKEHAAVHHLRSQVLEKLGRPKDALKAAKRVIDLAPDSTKGYIRSAKLFMLVSKPSSALPMLSLAEARTKSADVQATIASLRGSALAVQAALDKARTNYVQNLPLEIFHVIATHVGNPVRLSHVCAAWRRAALGSPALWRSLVVGKNRPVEKIKWFIELSDSHLDTVRLRLPENAPDVHHLFFPCAPSIRTLDVLTSSLRAALRFAKECTEYELDHFRLASRVGTPLAVHLPTVRHTLELENLIIPASPAGFSPIHGLRILRLSNVMQAPSSSEPSQKFIGLLGHCPEIEELTLRNCLWWDDYPPDDIDGDDRPPQLARLHSIALESCGHFAVDFLFRIDTPSLVSLDLRNYPASFRPSISPQLALLAARIPQLQHLRLSASPVCDKLLDALAQLPLLRTLDVARTSLTANFFAALGSSAPLLCPALTALNFSRCEVVRGRHVLELVRARLATTVAAPVDELVLDGCVNVEPEVLPWLRAKVERVSCVYETKTEAMRAPRHRHITVAV